MTDEELLSIAHRISTQTTMPPIAPYIFNEVTIIDFARAIEAKVREECAVICEEMAEADKGGWYSQIGLGARSCAEAIRGRGKE